VWTLVIVRKLSVGFRVLKGGWNYGFVKCGRWLNFEYLVLM